MRRHLTCLMLLAALVVPPSLKSAPAPQLKHPDVYALVYVGLGKNRKENVKRTTDAATAIKKIIQPLADPKIRNLAIVKRQKDDNAWLAEKLHVRSLEGTAILRVWLADGTPEEQVVIVNAIVSFYLKEAEGERLQTARYLAQLKRTAREEGKTKEMEALLQRVEERLHNLPRPLEWAAVDKCMP